MLDLTGKIAYVTGASSGIGFQVAKTLAQAGVKVAVTARSSGKLQTLCSEIKSQGGTAVAFTADMLKDDEIEKSLRDTVREFGGIDIVVHCAGMTIKRPLEKMQPAEWDQVIDTNLKSTYHVARFAHPYLSKSEYSKFVAIGSVGTYLGIPLSGAYCASKGGLVQLIKTLAVEWAQYKINVNAVCPGYVLTPLSESVLTVGDTYKRVVSRIPMGRIGSTEDIANAVLFLVSNMADYITGATLNVDGGLLSAAYTIETQS